MPWSLDAMSAEMWDACAASSRRRRTGKPPPQRGDQRLKPGAVWETVWAPEFQPPIDPEMVVWAGPAGHAAAVGRGTAVHRAPPRRRPVTCASSTWSRSLPRAAARLTQRIGIRHTREAAALDAGCRGTGLARQPAAGADGRKTHAERDADTVAMHLQETGTCSNTTSRKRSGTPREATTNARPAERKAACE